MEYIANHGAYQNVPVAEIVCAWQAEYGDHRIQQWIEGYEKSDGNPGRDFSREEVV